MNAFGITDKGKVRSVNQDAYRLNVSTNGEYVLAALCDGMGGVHGGEIASKIAADSFMQYAEDMLRSEPASDAAQILREGWRWQQLVQLPIAWAITLAVNSLRIVALVPVDAVFPKDHAPVVHLLAGVAFFLPAFAGVWWYSFNRVSYGKDKERRETPSG